MSLDLTAAAILAIPAAQAGTIFPGDAAAIRHAFRLLAPRWHPDRCRAPEADAVFTHLVALRDAALAQRGGAADGLILAGEDGREFRFRPRRIRDFELGRLLIAQGHLAWCIDPGQRDLARNGVARLAALPFADGGMRGEMAGLLPDIAAVLDGAEHFSVVLRKPAGMLGLRDLVDHAGPLPPRHVAWILGCLHHLACYLGFAGLVHGDISAETLFVDPARHAVGLLGGWWYATPFGGALVALPVRTLDVVPPALIAGERADPALDQALIRAVGRAIGDQAAMPDALRAWLDRTRFADPLTEYRAWQTARDAAFGPPRFVPLTVGFNDIY